MDSEPAEIEVFHWLKQKLSLFVPLRERLLVLMRQSPPLDIERGGAQPPAAEGHDPPLPTNTFSGILLSASHQRSSPCYCFCSGRMSVTFPASLHLFSLAITCAFATTFPQKFVIPHNNKLATLLKKNVKSFFAAAFFLAIIIPSPMWVRIIDGVVFFFCLLVVFKYGISSDKVIPITPD